MNETAKVCLEALVDALGLAVCLRVVTCAHTKRDPDQFEEFLPKCACEDPVTVGDNGVRKPMQLVNVIEEDLGNISSCERV